ncbi:flagellar hook-basal body complex protein FliE [Microvirga lenta]|uniref:flagellar hook-basal body complex protein FliE n=1 Tax=Microvirga lenta TaxID=2881337 RepID=UPI001CFEDD9C|nr:flagellar hook-basal body complex protein FliE [Microvirga lenta]MCB5173570.1 flagellar hook-basal body complex protein FliE [Microvirga lenta]
MIDAISSISAFVERAGEAAASSQVTSLQKAAPVAQAGQSADFGDMMLQVAAKATETLKAGEAAAISGIQGKASVQQVVEAVMAAEQTLQTAIAIRDKVVAAYLEISRMAI